MMIELTDEELHQVTHAVIVYEARQMNKPYTESLGDLRSAMDKLGIPHEPNIPAHLSGAHPQEGRTVLGSYLRDMDNRGIHFVASFDNGMCAEKRTNADLLDVIGNDVKYTLVSFTYPEASNG